MIIEILNNYIYMLQFTIVASLYFRMKHRFTIKRIVVVMITLSVITIPLYYLADIRIQMLVTVLYTLWMMCLLYDEEKKILIAFTLAMTAGLPLLNLMPDMIVMSIFSIVTGEMGEKEIYTTYSAIVSVIFLLSMGIVIYRGTDKGLKTMGWKYMVLFSMLLIADSIVILVLGNLALGSLEMSIQYKISYVLVVIGILIQLAMVIWFMLSREVYREKEIITHKYLESQMEHYRYLENREQDTKKFRHDIRNHMSMLSRLYKQQDYKMFDNYMEEIYGKINEFGNKISVNNGIADAILNRYYDEAEKKGILLKVEGHFPERCVISAYDICTILSNLLSNAIRAEEDCGGKEISVGCRYTDTEIIIEAENDYSAVLKDERGKLVTSKEDVFNHGFGLENVTECVERNHGYIDIQAENGRFRVLLSLKN